VFESALEGLLGLVIALTIAVLQGGTGDVGTDTGSDMGTGTGTDNVSLYHTAHSLRTHTHSNSNSYAYSGDSHIQSYSQSQSKVLARMLLPIVRGSGSWVQVLGDIYSAFSPDTSTSASASASASWSAGEGAGPGAWAGAEGDGGADGGTEGEDDETDMSPAQMRQYFPVVVVALLIMAFVIAAGVEETMKHFAVRCCR
jgi:hypothetical protein